MSNNQTTGDEIRQLRAELGDLGTAILDILLAHRFELYSLTAIWIIAALVALVWTVTK